MMYIEHSAHTEHMNHWALLLSEAKRARLAARPALAKSARKYAVAAVIPAWSNAIDLRSRQVQQAPCVPLAFLNRMCHRDRERAVHWKQIVRIAREW